MLRQSTPLQIHKILVHVSPHLLLPEVWSAAKTPGPLKSLLSLQLFISTFTVTYKQNKQFIDSATEDKAEIAYETINRIEHTYDTMHT
jgi:hypothetical protein